MFGFNVTQQTFSYDNRPQAPMVNYTFDEWWFVSIVTFHTFSLEVWFGGREHALRCSLRLE